MSRQSACGHQCARHHQGPDKQVEQEVPGHRRRQTLPPAFQQTAAGNQLPARQALVQGKFQHCTDQGSPEQGITKARTGYRGGNQVTGAQSVGKANDVRSSACLEVVA